MRGDIVAIRLLGHPALYMTKELVDVGGPCAVRIIMHKK